MPRHPRFTYLEVAGKQAFGGRSDPVEPVLGQSLVIRVPDALGLPESVPEVFLQGQSFFFRKPVVSIAGTSI